MFRFSSWTGACSRARHTSFRSSAGESERAPRPHPVSPKTVYQVLTGTGVRYDNNWAAISIAPDGSAYVGVLNGLIRVRDGVRAPGIVEPTLPAMVALNP